MSEQLVSILMPAYNAQTYLREAIDSVIAQTYPHWELIVVNDGSTDATAAMIDGYEDPRIRVFHKSNGGIGSARNLALEHARGRFMCGLDADDVFPPNSLASRLKVFNDHPDADIVDGTVLFLDKELKQRLRTYVPNFDGDPYDELVRLNSSCFMGFSWMVRWNPDMRYRFLEHLTHGEDLCFYLDYCRGRRYKYTHETILLYRRTGATTMSNLEGLARSYAKIHAWLVQGNVASRRQTSEFRRLSRMILIKSYLRARRPMEAIRVAFGVGTFGASND